jgi:hypothetical protein
MNMNIKNVAGKANHQPVLGEFINRDVLVLCMIVSPDENRPRKTARPADVMTYIFGA